MKVLPIKPFEVEPWLTQKHYAKRMPSISYAFGAFVNGDLCGIVTFGTSASSTLRYGVCGKKWENCVIELNRLVCSNEKNFASELVGKSIQMLPKPSIVVSYADTAQGHVGYVYQATNFLYTGLSAKFKDPKVKGLEAAVKQEEELRWALVSAQARIDVWRSQEASNRTMDKITL